MTEYKERAKEARRNAEIAMRQGLQKEALEFKRMESEANRAATYSNLVSQGRVINTPENVAKIQNKLRRTKGTSDDIDLDDAIEEMVTDREIDLDIGMDINLIDDYNDGDPWGDETDNFGEYD